MSKRQKDELNGQPTLFELEKASEPTNRRFSLPGIFLGTSSFTASDWDGTFYPQGIRSKDFLRHYASQFQTVEIDSTFYGTPAASTVTSWNEKTRRRLSRGNTIVKQRRTRPQKLAYALGSAC